MLTNTILTLSDNSTTMGSDLDLLQPEVKPRVLIVDDDPDYLDLLKIILRKADLDVSGVLDHRAAVEKCMELNPDVILLDLMMPGMDGYAAFNIIRKVTNAPVIFISAAHRSEHLIRALEIGGEDYISKPFENSEIIARVKKVLRAAGSVASQSVYYFPEIRLRIDFENQEVALHDQPVRLLPREFSMLRILAENAPHNVPYEKITLSLWGEDTERTRTHMKTIAFSLRRKLEQDPERPELLVNNRSVGYQLITQP